MDNDSPSMLKPTLIGGLTCGVAGGLPLIGAVNCACCALVMGAGFLAAYFYSNECKKIGMGFRPGSGAVVGLVAGLFYSLAHSLIGAFFMPSVDDIDMIVEQMESGGAPPEAIDGAMKFFELLTSGIGVVFYFFMILLLAAIFSTIGGLIGGAVFKVEPEAPAPADSGTPPPVPSD